MKLPRIFLIAITLTVGCGCLTAWAQIRRPTAKPQRKTNPTVHPTPTPSPTPTATPELHFEYGHSGEVNLLAFSLDGRMIASGSADETIKLWAVDAAVRPVTCLATLRAPGPYSGMKIGGVTGISDAQKAALVALGAVDE